MADGTVRGGFNLSTTQARKELRSARTESDRTMKSVKELGRALDGIGGAKMAGSLEEVRRDIRAVADDSEKTSTRVKSAWRSQTDQIERSVTKQIGFIKELNKELDELGRNRKNAVVNVDGVAESIAEVDALQRKLNQLGRTRVTANVGANTTAARSTTGALARDSGSISVPFAGSISSKALAGVAGVGLPAIQSLGGGATSILGSLGGAGLGAASLGAPGLLGLLGGGLGLAGGIKTLSQRRKATMTRQLRTLRQSYDKALRPQGQSNINDLFGTGLDVAGSLRPSVARLVGRTTATTAQQAKPFGQFLTRQGPRALNQAGGVFDDNLGNVRGTVQNLAGTFLNLEQAARPFFLEGTKFVDNWTGGWKDSTGDISSTRDTMRGFMTDLKAAGRLTGAGYDLLRDIFGASRPAGRTLLGDATEQLQKWDVWIQKNPRQVEGFFDRTAHSTEDIAKGLGSVVSLLNRVASAFQPILHIATQLATVTGSLGLGAPGVLSSLYGGLRGATGRPVGGGGLGGVLFGGLGGSSSRAPATSGGRSALGLAAGSGVLGTGAFAKVGGARTTFGAARGAGAGVLESIGLQGEALGGAARLGLGAAGKAYLPIGAVLSLLDAATFQGNIGQRAQAGLSSFTLGAIPRPHTSSELRDQGTAAGQAQLPGLKTQSQTLSAISAVQTQIEGTKGGLLTPGTGPGGLSTLPVLDTSHLPLIGGADDARKKYEAQLAVLQQQLETVKKINREQAKGASGPGAQGLGGGYKELLRQGVSPAAARKQLTKTFFNQQLPGYKATGSAAVSAGSESLIDTLRQVGAPAAQIKALEKRLQVTTSKVGQPGRFVGGKLIDETDLPRLAAAVNTPAGKYALSDPKSKLSKQIVALGTSTNRSGPGSVRGIFPMLRQYSADAAGNTIKGLSLSSAINPLLQGYGNGKRGGGGGLFAGVTARQLAGGGGGADPRASKAANDGLNKVGQKGGQTADKLGKVGANADKAKTPLGNVARPATRAGGSMRDAAKGADNVASSMPRLTRAIDQAIAAAGGRQRQGRRPRGGQMGMTITAGSGMGTDDVMIAPGQMAAKGEDVINRHTRGRIDQMLAPFGSSVRTELGRETRNHGAPPVQGSKAKSLLGDDGPILPGLKRGGAIGATATAAAPAGPLGPTPTSAAAAGGGITAMTARASALDAMHMPYLWGGGHGGFSQRPSGLDCSGSVSDVLHAAGYLSSPLTSGSLAAWGAAGAGTDHTVYANAEHTFMKLNGQFFGTSASNPGGGPGWIPSSVFSSGYLGGFTQRHAQAGSALATAPTRAPANGRRRQKRFKRGGTIADPATAGGSGLDSWLTQALQVTGHFSPQNLTLLEGRAMQESSGNPNAINNWDSNAAAGTPSQGLLQTIPATFAQYRVPSLSSSITDPVANAAAAVNYMFARYGHIVGPGSGGYARGGTIGGQAAGGPGSRGVDFAGWHKDGLRARFDRPTLIGVGEGMGSEDVVVKRAQRGPRGGGGGQMALGGHHVHVDVSIGHVHAGDADAAGGKIGKRIADELEKALKNHTRDPQEDLGD